MNHQPQSDEKENGQGKKKNKPSIDTAIFVTSNQPSVLDTVYYHWEDFLSSDTAMKKDEELTDK